MNHRNNNGWTPLSIAAQNINNIVVLLNACSADDEQRESAFQYVNLFVKKVVIDYYINKNQHTIIATFFNSLKPEE